MIKGYGEKLEIFYKSLREKNIKSQMEKREYVSKIHPEILNIERKINSLTLRLFKNKTNEEIENLNEIIDDLKIKKRKILKSINLPENYLDLEYECEKCKDTGYIIEKKCSCLFKKLGNLYLNDSDLKLLIKSNNFDNFDFSFFSKNKFRNDGLTPNKNIKAIYSDILKYIKNFENISTNLLFIGECGSGKTFLSHCIAKELLERGFLVIYKTSEELFQEIQFYYSNKNYHNNFKLIEESVLMQCDLLIIDDLGTETYNNNVHSNFFNFLNKKLLLDKKLLISTNFSLEYIRNHYSDRISSRIFGNFNIYNFFVDEDIRIQKKIRER